MDNHTKLMSEPVDFLTINPKGYVAALTLDTGDVLTEGPAIVQYLADLKPDSGLAQAMAPWSAPSFRNGSTSSPARSMLDRARCSTQTCRRRCGTSSRRS
ncbi:hypothetical protein [Agrobacterium fabrum]|uniref:hypothetical protein n=1 Tax=Agrobacterium fabrum TaxID=1176649 RepID=UPI001F226E6B|nr:hypothetical protein [Agrobacterium fabrum]MCX2878239.1 hypothetical protein [Agrobacterium fabrum]